MTDQKLEWMYRNSNEAVDREEYLLGKPIDKAFEQNSYGNEVEKDCLPTSIFTNSSSNIQVDVIRKMKEDPLEVIRQQEIERRKQLLKNPVKLKKLQNMLKEKQSQEEKEEEKKKKKFRSGDESQDIDRLLTSRYLSLMKKHGIKSLAELNSLKIHKKKKKKKAQSESSDTDYSEKTKKKEKRHSKSRNNDFSESDSEDFDQNQSKIHRDMKTFRNKKYGTSELDSAIKKKYKDRKELKKSVSKKDTRSSDSDREIVDKKKLKSLKNVKAKRKEDCSFESSDSDSATQEESCKTYKNNKWNKSFSPDKGKNSEKQINEYSDSSISDRKHKSKSKKKVKCEDPGTSYKSRLDDNKNDLSSKRYGLNLTKSNNYKEGQATNRKRQSRSKSPPTKKYLNDSSRLKKYSGKDDIKKNEYRDYKTNNSPYRDKKSKSLTEEEKQKKLEEMTSNAKWRDDFRVKNVSKYKKEEASENKEEYNEDFMRNQMLLATSSGSVEARIRSNINNIQRSKFSMSENFVRR